MLTKRQKADSLRKRVLPLILRDEVIEGVASQLDENLRYVKSLYKEWLGDVVTYEQGEYHPAARDPETHFLKWSRARIDDPYHVSDHVLTTVRRRYNIDFTTKLYFIVWPQEIAWAQRMRISQNPFVASKAGLFLASTKNNPRLVFERVADLYADAILTAEYSISPMHDMPPEEIRHTDRDPDFTPLFMRYTQKFLMEKINSLTSDQIAQMGQVAEATERAERLKEMTLRAIGHAERFPMRRDLTVISIALNLGLSATDLFLLEHAFLERLKDASKKNQHSLPPGSVTPQAAFITMLTDRTTMRAMLKDARLRLDGRFIPPDVWKIINFQRAWIHDELPQSYRRMGNLMNLLGRWQTDIVEERRPLPLDPVSDFGFFLTEKERAH